MHSIKSCIYRKSYYEKYKYKLAYKMVDEYIPRTIININAVIPQKVALLSEKYAYEQYMEKYVKKKIYDMGIKTTALCYDDCYSNAYLGYRYSICRCALCNYDYVDYYIKKMIKIMIVVGINMSQEMKMICNENNFKAVYLDDTRKRE